MALHFPPVTMKYIVCLVCSMMLMKMFTTQFPYNVYLFLVTWMLRTNTGRNTESRGTVVIIYSERTKNFNQEKHFHNILELRNRYKAA